MAGWNVKARTVLWYWVFAGFAVNFMAPINLNITIVEMVAKNPEIQPITEQNVTSVWNNTTNEPQSKLNSSIQFEDPKLAVNKEGTFQWDEYQQGLLLSSFFWFYWLTQIPGGILAKKYGTKLVFGLTNVLCCWLCFLMPVAAKWDWRLLIFLRVVQGLSSGFTWPAMNQLTACWIPPNERSKFVTSYFGNSLGIALSYPLFAYIMHWTSWEWVFHATGILGTIWWLGWILLIFDSPQEHPRISMEELTYIEKSLGSSVEKSSQNQQKTPWRHLLTSKAVWMCTIGMWGSAWGLFTLMTQAPTYFILMHNWNLKAAGFISGLPHILRVIFSILISIGADYLLRTDKMSRTNVRKLASSIGLIAMGVAVLIMAYVDTNPLATIVLLTLAVMFHGANSSGFMATTVDIAPNYAALVMGISSTIACITGFVSAYLVGIITLDNQTLAAWRLVFLICAATLIISGVLYVFFADSTLQDWNGHLPVDTFNHRLNGDRQNNLLQPLNKAEIRVK